MLSCDSSSSLPLLLASFRSTEEGHALLEVRSSCSQPQGRLTRTGGLWRGKPLVCGEEQLTGWERQWHLCRHLLLVAFPVTPLQAQRCWVPAGSGCRGTRRPHGRRESSRWLPGARCGPARCSAWVLREGELLPLQRTQN